MFKKFIIPLLLIIASALILIKVFNWTIMDYIIVLGVFLLSVVIGYNRPAK